MEMNWNEIVSNVKIYGMEDSIKASKYPMSTDASACDGVATKTVFSLAGCEIGTGHDNFLNGIVVQFDLTLPLKVWTEVQRYHFLDFVSSQSTMHRLCKFLTGENPERCFNKNVDKCVIEHVVMLAEKYLQEPTEKNFLRMLDNNPSGFILTARMTTNYRQLKTIYKQRKNHKRPEWRAFCKWIETLPNSEFVVGSAGNDGWHYLSKGENPKEEGVYLVSYMCEIHRENRVTTSAYKPGFPYGWRLDGVYAWRELPKPAKKGSGLN